MFLSELWKGRSEPVDSGTVETVSLGTAGTVVSSGYQSRKTMFAPGGMCWVPRRGQGVLVVKAGMEDCIAGAEMAETGDMLPGEVKLFSQGASVLLKNDGSIVLEGRVLINGKELTV